MDPVIPLMNPTEDHPMSQGSLIRHRLPAAVLLLALLAAPPARGVRAQQDGVPQGQKVFVTGHSFHVPSARPFDQIALSAGIDGHKLAGVQGIGGSSVTRHWDLPDDRDKARKAIKAGEV